MTDSESDTSSKPPSPKGKSTKVNFVLLKQILDEDLSEITDSDDQEVNLKENQPKKDDKSVDESEKVEKLESSCGPIGRYPVTFSKRCKSKSCQTRLSAFPLFSVPDDTEWISEDEVNFTPKKNKVKSLEKKKKKRRNSREIKTKEEEVNEKLSEKTKNPDGSRKDFSTEHQLKETKNPILQAWIQQKNKLARKTRREERKEKRAQRAALHEEERIKHEQHDLSDKKVKEWFKAKRKEARKLWRQNHPRISPFDMALDDQTEPPPPPEYKVVKTFQQRPRTVKPRRRSSSANSSTIIPEKVVENPHSISENLQPKCFESPSTANADDLNKLFSSSDKSHQKQRPKTARPARSETKPKLVRPKTAKPNPKTEATATNNESAKLTKSLTYDDWLKAKREQDKKRLVEQKRELTDSHLNSVISKLGKKRVENILSSRKQVDTGLKKFTRSDSNLQPAKKDFSYRWKNGHNLPRPEPQGCDCPEAEHTDTDGNMKAITGNSSPVTPRRKAVEFCKEVTEQCDELKPSMEKVLSVLDAEIKKSEKKTQKQNASKNTHSVVSTTNATFNDTEGHIDELSLPGSINEDDKLLARPKSARPKSAKPGIVNNTSLTSAQAEKKIFHDMDVLGLCNSDENLSKPENSVELGNEIENQATKMPGNHGNSVDMATRVKSDSKLDLSIDDGNHGNDSVARIPEVKSTVRSNYFDYGTDVDVPTMKSTNNAISS